MRRLPGPFVRLEVRNPIHGTHYRVLVPTYPERYAAMCTCTDFARSGLGTCKHVEAAIRWLAARPEEIADPDPARVETGPTWEEIDRRARAPPPAASPLRRMTWTGDLLLTSPPKGKEKKEEVGHRSRREA